VDEYSGFPEAGKLVNYFYKNTVIRANPSNPRHSCAIKDERTEQDRKMNRRVEIMVVSVGE
jgi:hypothetical protein